MAEHLEIGDALKLYRYLLLDTCVLIEEFLGKSSMLSLIPRGSRRTSVVALWEFVHGKEGTALARDLQKDRRDWLNDQGIIVPAEFSPGCGRTFRSLLWQDEGPPGVVDCLLAAESLARKWPLVTSNVRHFKDVPGLRLVPV
jgi:predicted nucleic acid-binding protein